MAVSAQSRDGATQGQLVNLDITGASRTLSDHSSYSRKRLGDGIYGGWYEAHCEAMRLGSAVLLKRILEARA